MVKGKNKMKKKYFQQKYLLNGVLVILSSRTSMLLSCNRLTKKKKKTEYRQVEIFFLFLEHSMMFTICIDGVIKRRLEGARVFQVSFFFPFPSFFSTTHTAHNTDSSFYVTIQQKNCFGGKWW